MKKAVNVNLELKVWKEFRKLMIDKGESASSAIENFMKKEVDVYGKKKDKS